MAEKKREMNERRRRDTGEINGYKRATREQKEKKGREQEDKVRLLIYKE